MKRIAAAFLCVLLVLLCACGRVYDESYVVIDRITPQTTPPPFNFSSTLYELFPECNCIFVGVIDKVDKDGAHFSVLEKIVGGIDDGYSGVAALADGPVPETGMQYLLFASQNEKETRLRTDDAGYLRVNGDTIIPQTGGASSFEQARIDIDNLKSNVVLPSSFYYYRSIDELVNASDYVFTGVVEEVGPLYTESFFSRTGGVEETYAQDATPVSVAVQVAYKGGLSGDIKLLLSQAMLDSTIIESTLKTTGYSTNDMPALEQNGEYLFFAVKSRGGSETPYMFFVNPFQGYVPVYDGYQLMSIPTNAVFSYPRTLSDVKDEIDAVLSGGGRVSYELGDASDAQQ